MHPADRQKMSNGALARGTRSLLTVAAILSLAIAATASAKPELTPFEEAVAHFKAGEYARAAPAFHIAYSRDSKPVLLFNAALSEQRSNQLELAQRDYKRVLSRTDLHPKIAERARKGLAEVEAALAAAGKGPPEPLQPKPEAGITAPVAPKPEPEPAAKPAPKPEPNPAPKPAPTAAAPARPAPGPAADAKGARPPPVGVKAGASATWQATAGWAGVGLGAVLTGLGGWLLTSWSADETAFLDSLERKDGKVVNLSGEAFQGRWDELGSQRNVALATTIGGLAVAGAGAALLLTTSASKSATLLPAGRGVALRLLF